MTKVKTVTHFKQAEVKKEITSNSIRNNVLKVLIIGYVASGENEPFEEDEVYYNLSVMTGDGELDIEVMDSTSLAKVKQRQLSLYNALYGYRGNTAKLVEYDDSKALNSDN